MAQQLLLLTLQQGLQQLGIRRSLYWMSTSACSSTRSSSSSSWVHLQQRSRLLQVLQQRQSSQQLATSC
jgi:hypothetical protein